MSAVVQRYRPDAGLDPADDGPAVLFSDVEAALHDAERFAWVLPIICGDDDRVANLRTQALAAGLIVGKTGRDLVDYAREGCTA